jgi:hypothetical protein
MGVRIDITEKRIEELKRRSEGTFKGERESARQNLTTALSSRFQWDKSYLKARADYDDRIGRLVESGHVSKDEERDLEEIVFWMACSAANAVAEAWYDSVTRTLLPAVGFEPAAEPATDEE